MSVRSVSVLADLERQLHKPAKATAHVGIRLSPDLKEYLQSLADEQGQSLSDFIKSCILKAVSGEAVKDLDDAEAPL